MINKYPNGLTVRELKEMLSTWPDTNSDGEPTLVWLEKDCLSIAVEISTLDDNNLVLVMYESERKEAQRLLLSLRQST